MSNKDNVYAGLNKCEASVKEILKIDPSEIQKFFYENMKKFFYPVFIIALFTIICLSFTGCNSSNPEKKVKKGKYVISEISMESCVENKDGVWKANWPDCYYISTSRVQMNNAKELTKEQRDFVYEFVNSLPTVAEGKDCLCLLYVNIRNSDDGSFLDTTGVKYIYDSYPEGYDEFVDIFNEVCGGDRKYITTNTDIPELTTEFVTARTGVTDMTVNGGTVQELLEHLNIDSVSKFNKYSFDLYDYANDYYFKKYLPYEIQTAPSTDEECAEYALRLATELGINENDVVKEYADYDDLEWYTLPGYGDYNLRVYRTELIEKCLVMDQSKHTFKIHENNQPPTSEFMGYYEYDFTYNEDSKFAVAVEERLSSEKDIFVDIGQAMEKIKTP